MKSGGRADLFQQPVIVADIILGGKLTVCVGGVGVNEPIAFITAVHSARAKGIALRQSPFSLSLLVTVTLKLTDVFYPAEGMPSEETSGHPLPSVLVS